MESFDYAKFKAENLGKPFIKHERYPDGCDKFDESIIDLFTELDLAEKSMPVTIFEKTVMRKFILQSTNKPFAERLKEINKKGIPIELFTEEALAMKIGSKKKKGGDINGRRTNKHN